MSTPNQQDKEVVLGVGEYAYIQEQTKGEIKVFTGPAVINQSGQERPIAYEHGKGWVPVLTLKDAVRKAPIAVEGYYLTLFNPPKLKEGEDLLSAQPRDGIAGQRAPELDTGKRVNIPGPASCALWPGQHARHVRGHQLHLNQYLLVQVYNEEQARKNWKNAVVQAAAPVDGDPPKATAVTIAPPKSLTVGSTYLVRGTEVSFYIPPTGIKVLEQSAEELALSGAVNPYVRDALTLERLEYCILVDENGKKRYEKGPQVVFPEPTERFVSSSKGERKFKALELTPIQGIHLKVIAPYDDKAGEEVLRSYKEGEELFITGKDTAIYYPREEHALIQYDGKAKHYATAIPAGEARYVLVRTTGEIKTIKGPDMYLPDPRTEVFVRRVLSDEQCKQWYPGNEEALEYNRQLRQVMLQSPTTRAGVVSDGDFDKSAARSKQLATNPRAGDTAKLRGNVAAAAASFNMEASVLGETSRAPGDEFERGSTYTEPRILTLNTKFQGVPTIEIWPGYAVQVIKKAQGRKVVVGPATVHLEYDESLEQLELSTGKPKTTDKLLKTCYLLVSANKVADIIEVETSDHVIVKLKLSYLVNFTSESSKWFNLSNYVKFMTDRMRSILKGEVHKISIAEFYRNYTDITRNIVLGGKVDGEKRGVQFSENGMRVDDVDVLAVEIVDSGIRSLLEGQQRQTVQHNIDIVNANAALMTKTELSRVQRSVAELDSANAKATAEDSILRLTFENEVSKARAEVATANQERAKEIAEAESALADFKNATEIARRKAVAEYEQFVAKVRQEGEIELLKAKTQATVDQYNAVSPSFTNALAELSNNETAAKLAQALSVQTILGGGSLADAANKVFGGTALEGIVKRVVEALPKDGNGKTVASGVRA